MITAVTLNPCVDRTLYLPKLRVGEHNVVERLQDDISGKGINVNVALANLGVPTKAVGFEFNHDGPLVGRFLSGFGIPFDCLPVDVSLRVNTKVFDMSAGVMTEINCKGPRISQEIGDRLMDVFLGSLEGTDMLVLDGSVPPGIRRDVYQVMTEHAHQRGIPVAADATGDLMENVLKAAPDLIKPNREELELLLGYPLRSRTECIAACQELLATGIRAVCLSLGGEGALYVCDQGVWFSPGIDIQVKSFQGAGDSLVAGICMGMLQGDPPEELLRSGVAAAHATLLRDGTQMCTKADYDSMMERIPVEKLQ